MRTPTELRIPSTDSEWSRGAHASAADAKRALILKGMSYWWNPEASYSREIGVAEVERRSDGSWGEPVWLGDMVANPGVEQRVRRLLLDPETAIVSPEMSHALGRDTDSGLAAWLGRPALVSARSDARLVDLELAFIAAHGIRSGRSEYHQALGGRQNSWGHNNQVTTMAAANAWKIVAGLLTSRVDAHRNKLASRPGRAIDQDLETRVADDRAAIEAIARYSTRLAERTARLTGNAYSLELPDADEIRQTVEKIRLCIDPPTPASEAMARIYSTSSYSASRTSSGAGTYRGEISALRSDLAACEGAIALLSPRPRGGRPATREALGQIAQAADRIWGLPKRRNTEHIESSIGELLTMAEGLRERARVTGADRRAAWSADLVAEEVESIATAYSEMLDAYSEGIGFAETLDEAIVGRMHALGRDLASRFPEPAKP